MKKLIPIGMGRVSISPFIPLNMALNSLTNGFVISQPNQPLSESTRKSEYLKIPEMQSVKKKT